ncbi:S-layer homology domain-containing protein [Brevibacillus borstelensis]|uniref:S-layer homology domain-containing protein n=1 Tax=Brevibacillus borstelensis TaxID=45462 RepID=UPI0030BB6B98
MSRFYKFLTSSVVIVLAIGGGTEAYIPAVHAARITDKQTDYQNHPHREAIDYVVKNKLMWLFPDGNFRPDQPVTQADLVAGLVNVKGLTSGDPVQELPSNHWAKVYYERAKRNGILEGVETDPNKVLNREEASKLMVNAWKSLFRLHRHVPQYYITSAVDSGWIQAKNGELPNAVSTTRYDSLGTLSRGEQALTLLSLHREFLGIQEAEIIATQFHQSLSSSAGTFRGTLPSLKGYDTRLAVQFKNRDVKTIDSGNFSLSSSQIEFAELTVKFKGESKSLVRYRYQNFPIFERVSTR